RRPRTLDVTEAHAAFDGRVLVTGGAGLGRPLRPGTDVNADLPDVGERRVERPGVGVVVTPDAELLDAADHRGAVLLEIAAGRRCAAVGADQRVGDHRAALVREGDRGATTAA